MKTFRNTWVLILATLLAGGCAGTSRLAPQSPETRSLQSPPVLLAVKSEGQGRLAVLWQPPQNLGEISKYRLYCRKADESFELKKEIDSAGVADGIQSEALDGFAAGDLLYFRMTSVGRSGQNTESKPSQVLGARLQETASELLVVIDLLDNSGIKGSQDPVVARYGDSISSLERAFDSCSSEALSEGSVALSGYGAVLWTCGGNDREPLTAGERTLIREFLDQGGNLFISGSGLGPALAGEKAESESREFYKDYLKAFYQEDWRAFKGKVVLEGAPDSAIFAKLQARLGRDTPGGEYPCRLEPYGGSDAVLYYDGVKGASAAAVAYVGNFGKPNTFSRMVYVGVAWESLSSAQERTEVLEGILDYLANVAPLKPPGFVRGTITDARTGAPIEGAEVSLLGGTNYRGKAVKTSSRADGAFALVALEGTYHLAFEAPGYQRVVLRNVKVCRHVQSKQSIALEPVPK